MFNSTSKLLIRSLTRLSQVNGYCTQTQDVKWDIMTAVCVERLPVVTPALTDLQRRYKEYLNQVEEENSMKSKHEVRHDTDLAHAEMIKTNNPAVDLDEVSKITAQDFEDASLEEFSNFQTAPIETEADKKNDQKSLERNLQNHLVLLIEQQLGKDKKFVLPQGKHSEGETLRQCAERILQETCGEDINIQIYGNAPTGFYKYKYPKEVNGVYGAKVFFYYGRHMKGQVKEDKKYKWLNRKELEVALPEKYYTSINKFLVEERQ